MRPMTGVLAACTLSFFGTVDAQQREAQEPGQQGLPASPHQEQVLGESKELFQRLDRNRDGSISKEEAQADPALSASWSKYDENGDQVLDQKEFEKASAESQALGPGQRGPREGLPETPHQRQVLRDGLFKRLDKNGDGSVSKSEAQGEDRLMAQWNQLDRNGDGKLDPGELSRFEQ